MSPAPAACKASEQVGRDRTMREMQLSVTKSDVLTLKFSLIR